MKLINCRNKTYGIGTNPSGGIAIEVQPENLEEAAMLGLSSLTWENFSGELKPAKRIVYKNMVKHVEGVPLGGDINPEWEKLQEYLGEDPLLWAKTKPTA